MGKYKTPLRKTIDWNTIKELDETYPAMENGETLLRKLSYIGIDVDFFEKQDAGALIRESDLGILAYYIYLRQLMAGGEGYYFITNPSDKAANDAFWERIGVTLRLTLEKQNEYLKILTKRGWIIPLKEPGSSRLLFTDRYAIQNFETTNRERKQSRENSRNYEARKKERAEKNRLKKAEKEQKKATQNVNADDEELPFL